MTRPQLSPVSSKQQQLVMPQQLTVTDRLPVFVSTHNIPGSV